MKIANITLILMFLMSSLAEATTFNEAYVRVEKKWTQLQQTSSLRRAYDRYVKEEAVASLTQDDLQIFKALISDWKVVDFDLQCQGSLEDSAARDSAYLICENGVKHVFGQVLRPRILTLKYGNGVTRQITVGLKKPASGFCTAIENQQGLFITSINTGIDHFNEEQVGQFHARDTQAHELMRQSRTDRLGKALYRCCQPEDNGKPNCLEKMKAALIEEGL